MNLRGSGDEATSDDATPNVRVLLTPTANDDLRGLGTMEAAQTVEFLRSTLAANSERWPALRLHGRDGDRVYVARSSAHTRVLFRPLNEAEKRDAPLDAGVIVLGIVQNDLQSQTLDAATMPASSATGPIAGLSDVPGERAVTASIPLMAVPILAARLLERRSDSSTVRTHEDVQGQSVSV